MSGRVIITGGSGLIGRAVTAELTAAGYEVVVLSRSPARVSGLPAGARAVGWDAETAEGWSKLAAGARAIVNLAGENLAAGPWTRERKQRILASRLAATGAVVSACQEVAEEGGEAPAVLLQGSAVGYYGARGDEILTEESSAGAGFLAEVTVDWEAASAPVESVGVRRTISRTGVVLASDGGALPKMALPFKLFVGGPVGDGAQWVPWIHLRDLARALRFLIEDAEASGAFNLTAPEPVTNRQLGEALGDVLGRPSFLRAPELAVRLALGEMSTVLLEGQRALPRRLVERGFQFHHTDLRAALKDLLG